MEKLSAGWDAACLRLEDFLRAHNVEPRERLLALTLTLLGEAKSLHATTPDVSPIACTMAHVAQVSDAWFAALAGDPERIARAKVAYFSSGRNDLFLDPSPPPEFVAAIRGAAIEAGPTLEFKSLLRKEVDYGAMEGIARETWDQFSWGHVLRTFLLWMGVFFAAWAAYVRFFR